MKSAKSRSPVDAPDTATLSRILKGLPITPFHSLGVNLIAIGTLLNHLLPLELKRLPFSRAPIPSSNSSLKELKSLPDRKDTETPTDGIDPYFQQQAASLTASLGLLGLKMLTVVE